MIGAARRFSELMSDLLLRRELAGGPLSQGAESDAAAELERCWWEMTEVEQAEAEGTFSPLHVPGAPHALDQLDETVAAGSHDFPRKAA